jgi:hypothetical protein
MGHKVKASRGPGIAISDWVGVFLVIKAIATLFAK